MPNLQPKIKCIKLANISQAYRVTKTIKFDILNDAQKHLLSKQFDASHCNGYSVAPISDYINNQIFQELQLEKDYFAEMKESILIGAIA